jgi:hypothetical protein
MTETVVAATTGEAHHRSRDRINPVTASLTIFFILLLLMSFDDTEVK